MQDFPIIGDMNEKAISPDINKTLASLHLWQTGLGKDTIGRKLHWKTSQKQDKLKGRADVPVQINDLQIKSFITKRVISISVNLRYSRL